MEPELKRAFDLQRRLERRLTASRKFDMLMEYRRWLDSNNIPAETDGWPSDDAYLDENIEAFLNDFCKVGGGE